MGNRKSAYEEVISLFDQLIKVIPRFVDGKDAILEMKDRGGRNWRQMEWIGFWFEFFLEKNLIPVLGGSRGPTFGTTQFDFKKKFVWDLKAHPSGTNNLILNDQNAIKNCVKSEKGLGFIIISGIGTVAPPAVLMWFWVKSSKSIYKTVCNKLFHPISLFG